MELKIYDYDNYNKDLSAQRIKNRLEQLLSNEEGLWLYREPEIKTEGNELPTYTIISPKIGLLFVKSFDLNDENLSYVCDKYWTIDGVDEKSRFQRFRNYCHAIKSRLDDPMLELTEEIPVNIIYVFPYIDKNIFQNVKTNDNEDIVYGTNINITIKSQVEAIDNDSFSILRHVVLNANILNKSTNIYVSEPAKNMFEAIELNNKKIASFDYDQMAASLTITDKSERIRGLAGSGKTVLLAMKAARLHNRFPDKKIAFVFYTKSLYNQANTLIRKYYNQIADDEPNWENLKVLHSWGGVTTGEGLYSYICKEHGITPKTLRQGDLASNCKELLNNENIQPLFDYILVDEAQDFPLEFFLLIEKIAKKPKKVVIAYDELQTTNDIKIPEFDELFGTTDGELNIPLEPQYDYILKKSYRNTLEVLLTAFSFGFGFYSNITQIIQDTTTWDALGFECKTQLESGKEVIIHRPQENSPNSISDLFDEEQSISCDVYKTDDEQSIAIAEKIKHLITDQKVKPTDILVIDVHMNKSSILNKIQYELQTRDISSHIPGIVSDSRDFFVENNVTLTTPRNAKGNEVSVVFVTGCEEIYSKSSIDQQRQARNFLFISITRSKGWVYLSATGRVKGVFNDEFKKIQKNLPNIKFVYPDDNKIKELAKIDFLTNNPQAKMLDDDIHKIKQALLSGNKEIVKQLIDLDPNFKKSLKDLLGE